jgi:predicted nuclease of predicted toxin-antitoxin system
MRLLADENVPGQVVASLRERGHDVLYIKESTPGADDRAVLALAQGQQRVVVTANSDFGELAFRSGLPAQCGIVLIRLDWTDPEADNQAVAAALTSRDDWSGIFAVVERDRVRIRPLPPARVDWPPSYDDP